MEGNMKNIETGVFYPFGKIKLNSKMILTNQKAHQIVLSGSKCQKGKVIQNA